MAVDGSPHPNWYPDPATVGRWRYWDGAQWTEHTAPMAGVATPEPTYSPVRSSPGPSEALHWLVPIGRSGESIAAGYLGFLCLFLTIPAFLPFAFIGTLPVAGLTIWLAVRAIKKAESGGHGRGRAIFGMVGAGFAVLASVVSVYATVAVVGA
jgi:hypothetical protein